MYTRPVEPTLDVDRRAVRQERAGARRRTRPRSRPGYDFGETAELFDHPYRGEAGQARRRAPTRTSPATPPWRGASWPPASSPKLPVFLGSYPITPASDILHELSKHKNFGVRTFQAEDEIAGIGSALGAAFGGHLGVTTTSGPGVALKSRDDRPGRQPRAAAARHRHPARRALDRAAHQDRGGRPAHGDVRPPRRVAAADRRGVQPVALLRRRHRGGPHRAQVPHAGDPAVRRLPGQRRRAVAAARRRRRCPTSRSRSPPSPTTSRDDGTEVFWPYLRDPETLAAAVGGARHARSHAPHRRHREGGRLRQHLLRRPTTTSAWSTCGPPRSPASPTTSRPIEVHGDARRRAARARLGLDVGRHRRRRRPGARARQEGGPRPPDAPQPVPGEPRRGAAPVSPRCSSPR